MIETTQDLTAPTTPARRRRQSVPAPRRNRELPPRVGLARKRTPARRGAAPRAVAARPRAITNGPERLDPAAERKLIEKYLPAVKQIAGGFQRRLPRNVLRDDLIAAGTAGAWDAIRKHGKEQRGNFDWYVRVRIRGAILDELRAQDWLPRRARAAADAASERSGVAVGAPVVVRFDEVSETEQSRCLSTPTTLGSEAVLDAKFLRDSLVAAVNKLPQRERHIVAMHYFRGIKFKDLGAELGVSEPRVSQLHSRALRLLRELVESEAAA